MNKKVFIVLALVLSLMVIVTACNGKDNDQPSASPSETAKSYAGEKVKMTAILVGLKGPTSMGMVRMFNEISSLSEFVDIEFDIVSTPDVITAGLLNGEITIAAVPTNMAAALYNKTEGNIRMLAVNTLGVIHIVADKSENIKSIDDLRGKTIVATGKGAVPEYVLNYILEKNGLIPGTDVAVEYRSDHSELATLVVLGEVKIAMLPQPFVTIVTGKNENVELALNLTNEWEKVSPEGSELPMGCLISTAEFAETYPEEVVELLTFYNTSMNWVNEEPEKAAVLIVERGILPDEKTALNAIPQSSIRFIYSQDSKEMMNTFFEILYEYNPKSVGGKIPDDDFYFKP